MRLIEQQQRRCQQQHVGIDHNGPDDGGRTHPADKPGRREVAGGTVYFTEGSDAPPNYIFPMYGFAGCSTTNINQFLDMLYRPLYWYGNNYSPTIDYN